MKIINDRFLAEYRLRGACEICNKMCHVREPAHVIARGLGGGKRMDVPLNLLALGSSIKMCCPCHTMQHQMNQPDDLEMFAMAAKREGCTLTPDEVRDRMWLILRTPRTRDPELCDHDGKAWRVGREWFACSLCGKSVYVARGLERWVDGP